MDVLIKTHYVLFLILEQITAAYKGIK